MIKDMIKILAILSILLLSPTNRSALAQEEIPTEDQYITISELTIGSTVAQDLLNLAEDSTPLDDGIIAYAFTSSSYSLPHIVQANQLGKITYLQLTIPPALLPYHRTQLALLGDAEATSFNVKSQIVFAFPSQGITYIVNGYNNEPYLVQRYSPKSVDEYKEAEGNIILNQKSREDYQNEPIPSDEATKSPNIGIYLIMTFSTIFLIGAFLIRRHLSRPKL
jgi:hypothetical protein